MKDSGARAWPVDPLDLTLRGGRRSVDSYPVPGEVSMVAVKRPYYLCLRHSHGGAGCESVHNHFFDSRASVSSFSSSAFPGACFRYHQRDMRETHDEQD